VNTNM